MALIGSDWSMSVIPHDSADLLDGLSWPEACVIGFLAYLRFVETGAVEPRTASGYLSAARFVLQCRNVDTSFIDSSPAISRYRRGM